MAEFDGHLCYCFDHQKLNLARYSLLQGLFYKILNFTRIVVAETPLKSAREVPIVIDFTRVARYIH